MDALIDEVCQKGKCKMSYVDMFADDRNLISYRPRLNKLTKGVTATILLQQVAHWWLVNKRQPFYKFREKCTHEKYRAGDSWTEELGFSGREFDTAISKIGTKITKGVSKAEALKKTDPKCLVIYWTDASRITWYMLNEELLENCLKRIYLEDDETAITFITEINTEINNINNKPPEKQKNDKPKGRAKESTAEGNLYPVAKALADVTGMDFDKNKGRLFRESKSFYTQNDATRLIADYGAGGPWFSNWRAKNGDKPSLAQIRETWGNLQPEPTRPTSNNGNGKPAPVYPTPQGV